MRPGRAPERLVAALHEIASCEDVATGEQAIRRHAGLLFPGLRLELDLAPPPEGSSDRTFALLARGRTVGHLRAGRSVRRRRQRVLLQAFAGQCALALDNVLTLAERDARARRDPLTGLLNHREFHEALDAALRRGAIEPGWGFAVAIFDLNRFKEVNDRGGHAAGDRVLRAASSAIATACRASDAAFRIGGDEFAMVLPDADADAAALVGRRAATAIGQVAHRDGASFGVAAWPQDGRSRDTLLHVADQAMYDHKRGVRDAPTSGPADHGPHSRLAVAARLATKLAPLDRATDIAAAAVSELHEAFGFFLAVVQRLDPDGVLRVVAAAGPLTAAPDFLASEQAVGEGVNGRVARTGRPAVVPDTGLDADYLRRDPRTDPGSELSLPIHSDGRIWGVLNLEQLATHAFGDDDLLLADVVAAQVGAALHRSVLTAELERSFSTTLGVLADALETKDPYTAEHAEQVADLAEAAGRRLGLAAPELKSLRYCALLHDIGKIGVRSDLLAKPARLTPEEFDEIKQHSAIGAALLLRVPLLAPIAPLVRAVHERHDGAGYPDGLAGEAIPIPSRIVAVCDALHAMTSDRPYRAGRPATEALAELQRCAGTQFDPRVVTAVCNAVATRPSPPARPVPVAPQAEICYELQAAPMRRPWRYALRPDRLREASVTGVAATQQVRRRERRPRPDA